MRSKKIIPIVLAVLLSVLTAAVPAAATSEITVAAGNVSANFGDTVALTVSLSGNTGLRTLGFDIGYDAVALTLLGAEDAGLFQNALFSKNDTGGRLRAAFVLHESSNANGALLTLRFKVNAEQGNFPISVTVLQASVSDENRLTPVAAKGIDGSVRVGSSSSVTLGDVDGNGKVQAIDARMILRHAAKVETLSGEPTLLCADVNDDGKINATDARRALRIASKLDPPKIVSRGS